MKVAYVSVQQQNEGFDAEIPVSYACIQKQEWKEASENSKTGRPFLPEPAGVCKFFTEDEMDDFFFELGKVNVVIVFNLRYLSNLVNKYYYDNCSVLDDFTFFDLQDMIMKQSNKSLRASITMLGDAVGSHRLVVNGLTFVHYWKAGELAQLRKCLDRDIEILRIAFKNVMQTTGITVKHTVTGRNHFISTPGWKQQILNTYKKTFHERCMFTLKQIKNLARDSNEGLARKFISESKLGYLAETGDIFVVYEKGGEEIIYHKSKRDKVDARFE